MARNPDQVIRLQTTDTVMNVLFFITRVRVNGPLEDENHFMALVIKRIATKL